VQRLKEALEAAPESQQQEAAAEPAPQGDQQQQQQQTTEPAQTQEQQQQGDAGEQGAPADGAKEVGMPHGIACQAMHG